MFVIFLATFIIRVIASFADSCFLEISHSVLVQVYVASVVRHIHLLNVFAIVHPWLVQIRLSSFQVGRLPRRVPIGL